MATPSFIVNNDAPPRSPSLGVYGYVVTYDSDVDTPDYFPSGLNTITLTGLDQFFTISDVEIRAITGSANLQSNAPAACYASYDEDTVVKFTDTLSGHDPSQAVIDFYLSSGIKTLVIWLS